MDKLEWETKQVKTTRTILYDTNTETVKEDHKHNKRRNI